MPPFDICLHLSLNFPSIMQALYRRKPFASRQSKGINMELMPFDCRLSPEGDRTDLNNYFTVTFAVLVTKSAMLASVKATPFKVQFSKVTAALGSRV